MRTEVKKKPQLGLLTTGWSYWPEHRRYYRLIEGELFVIPARADGRMWIHAADYDDLGGLCGFEINFYGGTPEESYGVDEVMRALALAAGWQPQTCPHCGFIWTAAAGHADCFDWGRVYSIAEGFIDTDSAGTALIPLTPQRPAWLPPPAGGC